MPLALENASAAFSETDAGTTGSPILLLSAPLLFVVTSFCRMAQQAGRAAGADGQNVYANV